MTHEYRPRSVPVRRRTIVKGAAWSLPVIAAATAIPRVAASNAGVLDGVTVRVDPVEEHTAGIIEDSITRVRVTIEGASALLTPGPATLIFACDSSLFDAPEPDQGAAPRHARSLRSDTGTALLGAHPRDPGTWWYLTTRLQSQEPADDTITLGIRMHTKQRDEHQPHTRTRFHAQVLPTTGLPTLEPVTSHWTPLHTTHTHVT